MTDRSGQTLEWISVPLASGLEQEATERKPFHNGENRKLARKKPQERGDRRVRRNQAGGGIPWGARV